MSHGYFHKRLRRHNIGFKVKSPTARHSLERGIDDNNYSATLK